MDALSAARGWRAREQSGARPGSVREKRRRWPERGNVPARVHWSVRREAFDGEGVLADLAPLADGDATLRIVTRYVVVRFVARALRGRCGTALEQERHAALEHAAAARAFVTAAEAEALGALALGAAAASPLEVCRRLADLAHAAARADETRGATACMRLAYRIARRAGAADAARQAAVWLRDRASADGARHAAAHWRRCAERCAGG